MTVPFDQTAEGQRFLASTFPAFATDVARLAAAAEKLAASLSYLVKAAEFSDGYLSMSPPTDSFVPPT